MVKVYTNGNLVDFEAPIYMDDEYFKKFCDFLGQLTKEDIEIIQVKEKERYNNPTKEEKHAKKWKAEELLLLLDTANSSEKLVQELKRTETSIKMQRAQFVPGFISWLDKKGFTSDKTNKDLIKKFLEDSNK
jgi:hypothetical protein